MVTYKSLEEYLRREQNLCVGERALEEIKLKVAPIARIKIKISGRSFVTGRKKTIHVPISKLLQ